MGWGQIPGDALAAEQARAEAIARAESRPMSPFERKLIGVLEDIRDRLPGDVMLPPPAPGDPLPSAHVSVVDRDGSVHDFGTGVLMTGLCAGAVSLDPLLDSEPAVLARSIQAGGVALANAFPAFREDLTAAGFEKFAEVAVEAALHEAARDRSDEVVSGGGPLRVDIAAALASYGSVKTIAERAWRGPGLYELASSAASTTVFYAAHRSYLADMIADRIRGEAALRELEQRVPPKTSEVQQGAEEEAGAGEPHEGPAPAAP